MFESNNCNHQPFKKKNEILYHSSVGIQNILCKLWRGCCFHVDQHLHRPRSTSISIELNRIVVVMPRNCQPGGQSGKLRVRYIPRRKLALVAAVRHVMEEEGLSQTKAAATLGVSQANISKWMKEHEHLVNAAKKPKKSSHPGPASQLSEIEDLLLRFIFEHREQGMAVTILMVVFKASALLDQFREDF